MRENKIEQRLKRAVEMRDGLCEKWTSGSSGWPDRICLFPDGKAGFVEVKRPGKKPRPLQLKQHRQLRRLGFPVYVLDGIEEIGGVLDGIQEGNL